MNSVVVIGSDHQNTLGVIRSLGEADFSVYAIIVSHTNKCFCLHSKYIKKGFASTNSKVVEILCSQDFLSFFNEAKVPIIPCNDESVLLIENVCERLQPYYFIPSFGSNYTVPDHMNKSIMLAEAQMAGLSVPSWVIYESGGDFQSVKKLKFPCLIKPLKLKPWGTFEYKILASFNDFLLYQNFMDKNFCQVLIQEYVSKTIEYGVVGCRLLNCGQTRFGGVIEKKRFSQLSMGSTTAGIITEDKKHLYEKIEKFVSTVDYRGIFDVEFISDGKNIYFVEINYRNGAYGFAYTKAGTNFPAIWASEAITNNCLQKNTSPSKLFFVNEFADFQNVRAGHISIFKWIKDVVFAQARMYINIKDPLPLFYKMFS